MDEWNGLPVRWVEHTPEKDFFKFAVRTKDGLVYLADNIESDEYGNVYLKGEFYMLMGGTLYKATSPKGEPQIVIPYHNLSRIEDPVELGVVSLAKNRSIVPIIATLLILDAIRSYASGDKIGVAKAGLGLILLSV